MKKQLLLLITIILLIPFMISGQNSCLPNGITFTSQGQIDSFEINFPGCTHIEGGVMLYGVFDNLYGLDSIITIDGNLELGRVGSIGIPCTPYDDILNDTIGLKNLQNIGGNLITRIRVINDFSGFENLQTIGGYFSIGFASKIISFAGLENLQTIGGGFSISNCPGGLFTMGLPISGFQNFSGLESLESIGGSFNLTGTADFIDFTGLENLTSVGEGIKFIDVRNYDNDTSNISLTGLENLQSIGVSDEYYQEYSVLISSTDIGDISALSNITKLDGNVKIYWSPLASLEGLHNIDTILGSVVLNKLDFLQGLEGLENLSHIGMDFILYENNALDNITGMENLQSIGGKLSITNNDVLMSLKGLDSIDHTTITNLELFGSPNLAICDVKSICDYLAVPTNPATISNNAMGCSNRVEVEDACEAVVNVNSIKPDEVQIHPNPTYGIIYIDDINEGQVEVFNSLGKMLMKSNFTFSIIDLSALPNGLYVLLIQSGGQRISKRIIKL